MAFIDDFKARFPGIATTTVDTYFPINENTYQCYFGAVYIGDGNCDDEAILQLMAHLITMDSNSGTSSLKDKASQAADGVSVSFNSVPVTSQNDAFFMSTIYGQRYLQLRAHHFGGFFV